MKRLNVVRTQLDVISRLPRPITILTAGNDKALALSTKLAGNVDVGRVKSDDARAIAAAQEYNLQVVDLTAIDDGDGNHHSKYSNSAPVIAAIGKRLKQGNEAPRQAGVAAAVADVGTSLLKVPATVLAAPAVLP